MQRVSSASVDVDGATVGAIEGGLLVYAAGAADDDDSDLQYIADKIGNLRIFEDDAGKLNRSVLEISGAVLLVSAFTVLADARKGRRPSFDGAAPHAIAEPQIERLAALLAQTGLRVESGRFRAHMLVHSINHGPICVLLDSRRVV
ncbi:MAG: D-tyrosyl-tRNA(Tyr) deacylase [Phycisphaerales bacterium]|nr:D-tyrosyl-tRNA(Tyr) deacylase [Phycisphaerales bacterium]